MSNHKSKYKIDHENTLVVHNVNYDDEGKYMCFSQSPRLERNVSAMLDVHVTQKFTTSPLPTKVLYGFNATFECVSVGIPTPLVTWARKVGEEYENLKNTNKYVIGATSLTIVGATYGDELEYACFSQSPRLKRNATAKLDVYVTQNFDVSPKGSRVLYGNSYTLHCQSTGIPTPTIS
jgi:hypothetical protein